MDILERLSQYIEEDFAPAPNGGNGADGVIGDMGVGTNTRKVAKHINRKQIIDPNCKRKKKKKKIDELIEEIVLDIEIGDVVLGGRFKNKKIKVNKIGKNDKGDITINDRPFMKIRIPEKRPVDNPDDSEIDTDKGEGHTEPVY
jgi:hypothetical protein